MFRFFGKPSEADLDEAFRESYQKPGAAYLGLAVGFATLTIVIFYLSDAVSGEDPWMELVDVLGGVITLSSLEVVGTVVDVTVPIEIASDSETPAPEGHGQASERLVVADVSLPSERRNRVVSLRQSMLRWAPCVATSSSWKTTS